MSAILSADDLNDFISPGVACIKPVENLPAAPPPDPLNPYEVIQEDKLPESASAAKTAQISLTDCLACSGCVTSAEAVLVSLQSHKEVLENLRAHSRRREESHGGEEMKGGRRKRRGKTFVALISPQSLASLSAAYGVSRREAGWMVEWLLSGRSEVGVKGRVPGSDGEGNGEGAGFKCVIDTDIGRDISLVYAFEEVWESLQTSATTTKNDESKRAAVGARRRRAEGGDNAEENTTTATKRPILTSACPGFICYAENTHPYLIPHLSRLKSPQAILATMVKTLLPRIIAREEAEEDGVVATDSAQGEEDVEGPESIYVVGIQPCFDKKLEGARGELTSAAWRDEDVGGGGGAASTAVRDVDCVITTRELISLAEECGIDFGKLPRRPLDTPTTPSLPSSLESLLLLNQKSTSLTLFPTAPINAIPTGTSGGYLHYILLRLQSLHPTSQISILKGRNSDTTEYTLYYPPSSPSSFPPASLYSPPPPNSTLITKLARSYGFRNIQNLVRKLKPASHRRVLPRYGKAIKTASKTASPASPTAKDSTGAEYIYVEVMACPGGCTNGGGQIKADDDIILLNQVQIQNQNQPPSTTTMEKSKVTLTLTPSANREWLQKVDEAYWSDDDDYSAPPSTPTPSLSHAEVSPEDKIKALMSDFENATRVGIEKVLWTKYKKVEDEFNRDRVNGKDKEEEVSSVVRVAELAARSGGGW